MKFNNRQFRPTFVPRVTRPNEAWMVDFAVLDFVNRTLAMLVVDVGTRRPLSATISLAIGEDVASTLVRLARRSGRPEQIWADQYYGFSFRYALQPWADQHRISIVYCPMQAPTLKSIAEPPLRNLSAHLRDKRFPTLLELGHEIERWRQSYVAAAPTCIPNVDQ